MMAVQGTLGGVRLTDLLEGLVCDASGQGCLPDLDIQGLCLDSRTAAVGDLFIARQGTRVDASQFLAAAAKRGAVAAVVARSSLAHTPSVLDTLPPGFGLIEVDDVDAALGTIAHRFYGEPSECLTLIGVTGTNGKTSVAYLIASAFAAGSAEPGGGQGRQDADSGRCGYLGTIGSGFPGELTGAELTTPDAIGLSRSLADLRSRGARWAALEVSSHALDQKRVDGLRIRGAVFTNLTHYYLDYHGSFTAYGLAKQRLFQHPDLTFAVLNADDPAADLMGAAVSASVRRVLCTVAEHEQTEPLVASAGPSREHEHEDGRQHENLHLAIVATSERGMTLDVSGSFGDGQIQSTLVGRFNASNLALALGVLLASGLTMDTACARLGTCEAPPGRLQRVPESDGPSAGPVAIVDYSHTPDALDKALATIGEFVRGRIWCVFGCGGDRDAAKRPLMGSIAARGADCLVVTDDNPRGEASADIIAAIVAGIPAGVDCRVVPDRGRAIGYAIGSASAQDVVLIAGKGHEDYQEVAGVRRPFSDLAMARAALRRRSR